MQYKLCTLLFCGEGTVASRPSSTRTFLVIFVQFTHKRLFSILVTSRDVASVPSPIVTRRQVCSAWRVWGLTPIYFTTCNVNRWPIVFHSIFYKMILLNHRIFMFLQLLSPDAMHAQELEQFKAIIRQQDAEVTALKAKLVGELVDVTCVWN